MSSQSIRRLGVRAAVVLGLVAALASPWAIPAGVSPAVAQDENLPNLEPTAAPAPALSPAGSGPGTGSGTSQPKPAGSDVPPPPPLGAVTYENALQDERVFKAGHCFGQNAKGHYVGEGFRMWVVGRCPLILEESTLSVYANGVTVGDGEVALDFKVVDGFERAKVGLYVRNVKEQLIGAYVHPARAEASLFTQDGGTQTDLGYRSNLGAFLKPHDWNRLAMRVSGHNAWLLLNDEPVLHSGEVYADAGRVIIELVREGDLDDGQEVTAVFRDLQLSELEGGEPGRAPTGP